jgi:hypothetical protein
MRFRGTALALALAATFSATGSSHEPEVARGGVRTYETAIVQPPPREPERATEPSRVALEENWRGLGSGCAYLAPTGGVSARDGSVDVVFHFHAGHVTEREMRESGLAAVFVSCGWGQGSGDYAKAFADPTRFDRMTARLIAELAKSSGRADLTLRHTALSSWSAGYGSIGKILAVPRYYARVDAVVLLDSLHGRYKGGAQAPAEGAEAVDIAGLASFVAFAKDAAAGQKAMVITHSSIVPPSYPSAAETAGALLASLRVPIETREETTRAGLTGYYRADVGNLHVRGFRGGEPRDHFAQLHLVGEELRAWVLPRWSR